MIERVYLNQKELDNIKRSFMSQGIPFNQGVSGISTINNDSNGNRFKYIYSHTAKPFKDLLDNQVKLMTDGEIARNVLTYYFPHYKGDYVSSNLYHLFDKPVPKYLADVKKGYGHYLDITAAHAQIYSNLCLGEGKSLSIYNNQASLIDVCSSLWYHKGARNAVVGTFKSHSFSKFDGKKFKDVPYRNKWLNPYAWSVISDVTMYIAYIMVKEFGCIYWNNDGGVFDKDISMSLPNRDKAPWMWLNDNGFMPLDVGDRPKWVCGGTYEIRGWGAYFVDGVTWDGKHSIAETKQFYLRKQSEHFYNPYNFMPEVLNNNLDVVERNLEYYEKRFTDYKQRSQVVKHYRDSLGVNVRRNGIKQLQDNSVYQN